VAGLGGGSWDDISSEALFQESDDAEPHRERQHDHSDDGHELNKAPTSPLGADARPFSFNHPGSPLGTDGPVIRLIRA